MAIPILIYRPYPYTCSIAVPVDNLMITIAFRKPYESCKIIHARLPVVGAEDPIPSKLYWVTSISMWDLL